MSQDIAVLAKSHDGFYNETIMSKTELTKVKLFGVLLNDGQVKDVSTDNWMIDVWNNLKSGCTVLHPKLKCVLVPVNKSEVVA